MPEGVDREDSDRAYRLQRDEPLDDGLRRIAAGRAERALERLRGAEPLDSGFADAVHGARKDLKKLRAVLRLLRDPLGKRAYEEQNGRCRNAARLLSESRDATVRLETLAALGERFADLPPAAFAAWREGLERDCAQRAEETDGTAVSESIELIEAARARIAEWELDSGSWSLIDAGVLRTYRRGRRAMREAETDPSEESFHQWRKRAKDLWYLLRILHPAWPDLLEPSAEQAHRLADLLGDHHDLAVLRADLAGRHFSAEDSDAFAAAIATREDELAGAAFDLGRRLYAEKPGAFRRRLRAYLRSWRQS
jgi:CHAD domain-containing protein